MDYQLSFVYFLCQFPIQILNMIEIKHIGNLKIPIMLRIIVEYVRIFNKRFKYGYFSKIYGILRSSRTLLAISNFKNIFFSSRTFPELQERVATL